jgi:hypothetical protein
MWHRCWCAGAVLVLCVGVETAADPARCSPHPPPSDASQASWVTPGSTAWRQTQAEWLTTGLCCAHGRAARLLQQLLRPRLHQQGWQQWRLLQGQAEDWALAAAMCRCVSCVCVCRACVCMLGGEMRTRVRESGWCVALAFTTQGAAATRTTKPTTRQSYAYHNFSRLLLKVPEHTW